MNRWNWTHHAIQRFRERFPDANAELVVPGNTTTLGRKHAKRLGRHCDDKTAQLRFHPELNAIVVVAKKSIVTIVPAAR